MQRKVFVATGAIAIIGGLATAALSSSCDTVCTTEARASVTLRVTTADGSALSTANVDKVWYRVSDEAAPRSAIENAPEVPDPGGDLTTPDSEWKLAECADSECTEWVLGYETEGFYEIKASVCGNTHEARAFVGMTADGCHVDTEEIEIMVDADGCAAEDGPAVAVPEPVDCTLESRPSMVLELVDTTKGTGYQVTADRVYAFADGNTTPIEGQCLNEGCSIWSIGHEQEGRFTVHAEVCGETSQTEVGVEKTADGCHVDTHYDLFEVDASSCEKPFTAELPEVGPKCDRMARPSALVFVAQDQGDVWAPVKVDEVIYEHDDTRGKAWCLDGDCSLGTYIVGWEQEGRFKVKTEVCGKEFGTEFAVGMTDDGCHVDTEFIPIMVDQTGCLGTGSPGGGGGTPTPPITK